MPPPYPPWRGSPVLRAIVPLRRPDSIFRPPGRRRAPVSGFAPPLRHSPSERHHSLRVGDYQVRRRRLPPPPPPLQGLHPTWKLTMPFKGSRSIPVGKGQGSEMSRRSSAVPRPHPDRSGGGHHHSRALPREQAPEQGPGRPGAPPGASKMRRRQIPPPGTRRSRSPKAGRLLR